MGVRARDRQELRLQPSLATGGLPLARGADRVARRHRQQERQLAAERGEDAQIPEAQRERLRWLGGFTKRYGEALYGTRPWQRAEGETADGTRLRFTARGETLYAWLLGGANAAPRELELLGVRAESARLVGAGSLACAPTARGVRIALPALPDEPAHAIALVAARDASA
jgi:alpha-L-fucosidase